MYASERIVTPETTAFRCRPDPSADGKRPTRCRPARFFVRRAENDRVRRVAVHQYGLAGCPGWDDPWPDLDGPRANRRDVRLGTYSCGGRCLSTAVATGRISNARNIRQLSARTGRRLEKRPKYGRYAGDGPQVVASLSSVGRSRRGRHAHVRGDRQLVHTESSDPLGLGGGHDGVRVGRRHLGTAPGHHLVSSRRLQWS